MKKQRKHYTPEEKVAILRRHLVEGVPISDLCDELGLQPTVFYRWQKEFFENGAAAFQQRECIRPRTPLSLEDARRLVEGYEKAPQTSSNHNGHGFLRFQRGWHLLCITSELDGPCESRGCPRSPSQCFCWIGLRAEIYTQGPAPRAGEV